MTSEEKRIRLRQHLLTQESQGLCELKDAHRDFGDLFDFLFSRNLQRRVNDGRIEEKTAILLEIEKCDQGELTLDTKSEESLWWLISRLDGLMCTKELQVSTETEDDEELEHLYNICFEIDGGR